MKQAVSIGINYNRTPNQLNGCLNDAYDWAALLKNAGFMVDTLLEKAATRAAILRAFRTLVADANDGDVVCLTYSGHGTWIPDTNGDEADGRDECLCPIDMGRDGHNLIVDDEIGAILFKLKPGAKFLFISDSCHSGTVLREVQIGTQPNRVRFIPPERFIDSPKLLKRAERIAKLPMIPAGEESIPGVILISGCRDDQYSNDAIFNNRSNGALSYFAVRAFAQALAGGRSYADVMTAIAKDLPSPYYQQDPQITAPEALKSSLVF